MVPDALNFEIDVIGFCNGMLAVGCFSTILLKLIFRTYVMFCVQ